MTIVIFSFEGKRQIGGVARLCIELSSALNRIGLNAEFLTEMTTRGQESNDLSMTLRKTPSLTHAFRAYRQLRSLGPSDVLICGQWYPEGLLALGSGKRPQVTLAHGSELMPSTAWWRRRLWHWLRGKVFTRSYSVICSSTYSRDLVLNAYPSTNAVAVPLAVNTEMFFPGNKAQAKRRFNVQSKLVISSVSRLYEYKGHETVFRGLAGLPAYMRDDFVYLIAGTGPDRDLLEHKARELGVESLIQWLGFVPEHELIELYRASDVFVLCTREDDTRQEVEGFGLVFLEAQACATPVIGTRTGGIPDAIEEGNGGWLIPQNEPDALTDLLSRLHGDPESFECMGRLARLRIESGSTWSQYALRFLDSASINANGNLKSGTETL